MASTGTTGGNSPDIKKHKKAAPAPWYTIFTKQDEQYNAYMRDEWGREKHGDSELFEKMTLEGAQSGLSWLTILRKRQAYRTTFHNFDIEKVAAMTPADVDRILNSDTTDKNDMVVRHRGKIESTISNAQCIQQLDEPFGTFLWSFVNHQPILNQLDASLSNAPTKSKESEQMSKELKRRGFRFVGPTTMYALMQATGMVIDHPVDSPEWKDAHKRLQKRAGGYQEGIKIGTK